MKQAFTLLVTFILLSDIASATNKFWVGPVNGNWSSSANWSLMSGGNGGAGKPGPTDDVNFTTTTRIVVDVSSVIHSIYTNFGTAKVLLIANSNISITITGALNIGSGGYLKDSTTANVLFDVNFANGSSASIQGDWIFEGGTPVTGNNGASFNAPLGTFVNVSMSPIAFNGGRIICNKNSKTINSVFSSLHFGYSSYFISDNVLNAAIPIASWAKDSISSQSPQDGILLASASTIILSGNLSSVHYLGGTPYYGKMVINLSTLTSDVSLSLPDGSKIRGNLEIQSTNNHNLTLLSDVSNTSSVLVEIGTNESGSLFGGYLVIGGPSRVALAKASAATAAYSYRLLVDKSYKQSGGNFSLQDFDGATGSSILDVVDDMLETGGTFITNSTATFPSTKFEVIMDDPKFNSGPSGYFYSGRNLSISSGTIDNGRRMVTLTINHNVYNLSPFTDIQNGVILGSPLTVGKLKLIKGPLTTTTINNITVLDPSVNAVTVGSNNSYVNGPLRRATNSTNTYNFPTGVGNTMASGYLFDSCQVAPATADASMYEAQYFNIPLLAQGTAAPLQGVSTNKCWNISRIAGADARITLIMHGAVTGSTLLKGIVVANYENPSWVKANGTVLLPGTAITGSVTSKTMTSFGLFTFGYGVPRSLASQVITKDLGVSTLSNNSVVAAKINQDAMTAPAIYPNPFVDNFTIDFYNPGSTNIILNIYDLKGSLVHSQKLSALATGKNSVRINMAGKNMPAANYMAQLNINGAVINTIKLLKIK